MPQHFGALRRSERTGSVFWADYEQVVMSLAKLLVRFPRLLKDNNAQGELGSVQSFAVVVEWRVRAVFFG